MHIGQGDARLAVRVWSGSGPQAVLIHGIGSSGASWIPLAGRLQTRLSPVAIDLRGHGDSGKPAHGYLYRDYVGDLDRVLTELNISDPVLIGHSLGGIVALWWAARNPTTAAAIVVVDSPLRSGEDFRPAFDDWIQQNAMPASQLARLFRDRHPDWSEERAATRADIMTSTAPAVFSELKADSMAHDGRDRIAEITGIQSPVLLVHGDLETGGMVQPADRNALVQRLPNAASVRIPGAGHALHRERPDEFMAAIDPFLLEHIPAANVRAGSSAQS